MLLDVRTPMNMAVMAPLVDHMRLDPRVRFFVTSSENPDNIDDATGPRDPVLQPIHPRRATFTAFDACLSADLVWPPLWRGVPRVLLFHGVAGKYGRVYDAPTSSMRAWDRLFFINRRRLDNFVKAGAIDGDSAAARLVGYPKLDKLVDGTLRRNAVLDTMGIPHDARTILYAPTWTAHSSLNTMGEALVRRLVSDGYTVIVKLHDRSRDPRVVNSGGVDWPARIARILGDRGILATHADATPLLAAADVLVTDHSSVGFEYLLTDRPVVRVHLPELLASADIHSDYVSLLRDASHSVSTVDEAAQAVALALASPGALSVERARVAKELFHRPGTAAARAVAELYELMELDPWPGGSCASQVSHAEAT